MINASTTSYEWFLKQPQYACYTTLLFSSHYGTYSPFKKMKMVFKSASKTYKVYHPEQASLQIRFKFRIYV